MVKTFKQFLEGKRFAELTNIDPQTSTAIIASLVGAQQPNNVNNVADNLAKKNSPLVAAIANSPATELIKAKTDALKRKNQPNQQQQNNMNIGMNALGALPGTQM